MSTARTRLLALLATAALAACGADPSPREEPASLSDEEALSAGLLRTADLSIVSARPTVIAGTPVEPGGSTLVASFIEVPDQCVTSDLGECTVSMCPNDMSDRLTFVDAGTLTVRGARSPSPLVATFDEEAGGYFGMLERRFAPGEQLSVRVAGSAKVPSFKASLVVPHPIRVTAPALPVVDTSGRPPWPTPKPYELDRAKDLEVTWTGGGAGKVEVRFATFNVVKLGPPEPIGDAGCPADAGPCVDPTQQRIEIRDSVEVVCHFTPKRQRGVVPARALAFLQLGTTDAEGSIEAVSSAKRRAGRWRARTRVTYQSPGSPDAAFGSLAQSAVRVVR